MTYVRKLTPLSERTLMKNETKELPTFWVCDIESFKWIHLVTIGLTDGENFYDFGIPKDRYVKEMRFKSLSVSPFKPFKRMFAPASFELKQEALERFLEVLVSDGKSKKVYAHFGGKFDFQFFLNYLFFHEDWTVESIIPRGSGILCFDAVVEMGNGKKVKIGFNDSSAMMPFGLKSLTNNFKVESLKKEWNHAWTTPFETKELVKYCEFDCRGLHQVIQKYHTWPIIKRAGSAGTIAGQAMKVLRTMMHTEVWSLKPRVDRFVRTAYFGGRTEIFKPLFTGPGRLRCYDVNSLYPTVMRDPPVIGDIPKGYPSKFKYFTVEYEPDAIGFYEAEVEVPDDMYVPPLGVNWKIDGHTKYIFPTGKFRGVWSTLDLEYAKTLGVKVKTGRGVIFENNGNFFRKYVDNLYEIREKSDRESVDNVLAKLLLNSCYGRFGLRVDREGLVVDEGQLGLVEGTDNQGYTLEQNGSLMRLLREPKTLETFNNVAVSAWVTSASRVFMHQKYMINPQALYYTDTDSEFTTDLYEDAKGLGGMKLEYDCAEACFLLPKTYVVQGIGKEFRQTNTPGKLKPDKKVTMKGFDRKKTGNFTVDDFMTALEGDLRRLSVTQDPKFATFKTALGKGKILTMLPSSERAIRSMYDKRIIFKTENQTYDTRAHKIVDNEEIFLKR
jgi:hypothetical protein